VDYTTGGAQSREGLNSLVLLKEMLLANGAAKGAHLATIDSAIVGGLVGVSRWFEVASPNQGWRHWVKTGEVFHRRGADFDEFWHLVHATRLLGLRSLGGIDLQIDVPSFFLAAQDPDGSWGSADNTAVVMSLLACDPMADALALRPPSGGRPPQNTSPR